MLFCLNLLLCPNQQGMLFFFPCCSHAVLKAKVNNLNMEVGVSVLQCHLRVQRYHLTDKYLLFGQTNLCTQALFT